MICRGSVITAVLSFRIAWQGGGGGRFIPLCVVGVVLSVELCVVCEKIIIYCFYASKSFYDIEKFSIFAS